MECGCSSGKRSPMSLHESITVWIRQLRAGEAEAAQKVWEAYFSRLVAVARKRLGGARRTLADEEDVALSALNSLCVGAREGRFPQLVDRDSLWPLLVAITAHKSVDLLRGENRRKRGGTGGEKSPVADGAPANRPTPDPTPLSQVIGSEPTPEFAAEMADQLRHLLERLRGTGDPDLERIALARMQGLTTVEIAAELGCVRRTVERKLQLIARLWEEDESP